MGSHVTAPGEQLGFGALLKDTSVVLKEDTPPPTIPAGPEIRTHNLPLTSPTCYPLGMKQGWAVFSNTCISNTYCIHVCILYLNTFNLSIFVFSKYIKYFLPINLLLDSTSSDLKYATFIHVSCRCLTPSRIGVMKFLDSCKEIRNNTAFMCYQNFLFPISEVLITSMLHSSALLWKE